MSRSEQLHDASMDEILASIRKIITDDEPEAPAEDAFSASAIDEFREASAALARNRPSGGYMHDLTRALAGDAPAAADDDIFDDGDSEPEHSAPEPALEDEFDASTVTLAPPPDDDEDLFEAEPELAPGLEASAMPPAAASEEDEEIIEDLGDPIMLGPEIELVEEAPVVPLAVAPVEPEAATETAAPELEAPASVTVEPAQNIGETVASAPVIEAPVSAAPPPPPPPPVVSAMVEEAAASVVDVATEAVADVSKAQTETIAEVAADEVAETPVLDASPIVEAAAEAIAETAVEAVVEPGIPAVEAVGAEAVSDTAMEPVVQSLEAKAAALFQEIASPATPAPVAEEAATMAGDMSAPAPEPVNVGEPAVEPAQPSDAPLVPDDMMAAMLKPMLKDWLDANMPRIVAKAMGGKDDAAAPES